MPNDRAAAPPGWGHPPVWQLAVFAGVYVLAGGFGQGLKLVPGVSIIFWPPAGLFLAALLLNPRRTWPWWIAAGCAAELTCNAVWFHNPVGWAALYFGANALEAVTAAWLVGRYGPKPFRLETFPDVARFVGLAALLAPTVGATLIALIDELRGKHPFAVVWPLVWLGDGTGLLVSTPLALVAVRAWRGRDAVSAREAAEVAAVGLVLVGLAALAFRGVLPTVYLTLPAVLWAAGRFELRGAAAAVAALALLTAGFTRAGDGEFAGDPHEMHEKAVQLQTFLGVAAASALLVAALSVQLRQALRATRAANAVLEERVAERTAELRHLDDRMRYALEAADSIAWDWDLTAGTVARSVAGAKTLGLADAGTADELLALVHPDDRGRVRAAWDAAAAGDGDEYRAEFRLVLPDGRVRWMADRGRLREDPVTGRPHLSGVCVDVTARKAAEADAEEARRRFERIAEISPDLIYLFDLDARRNLFTNPAGGRLLGLTGGQIRGLGDRLLPGLVHPDDWPRVQAAYERVLRLADGETVESEYRLRHADGSYRWVCGRDVVFDRHPDGRPRTALGVATDVTARRRAEAELRASEQRFRSLVAASAPVLYRMAPDWAVMLELAGSRFVPPAAAPRADWLDVYVSAEDRDRVRAAAAAAARTGTPLELEHRVPRADGSTGWVLTRAVPVRDEAGAVVEWFGAATDITDRKAAEAGQAASEERFRRMADAVPQIVYVTAAGGTIEFVNRRWAEYTGQPSAETADLPAVVHPDDLPGMVERWTRAMATGGELTAEFRLRRAADAAYRWFLTRAVPEVGPDGRVVRWFGTSTDIDDLKRLEADLRASEERFRLAADAVHGLMYEAVPGTNRVWRSAALHRLLGFTPEEAEPTFEWWLDRIHPDDRPGLLAQGARFRTERREFYTNRYRVRHRDGHYVHVWEQGQCRYAPDGTPVRMLGCTLDVTAEVEVEAALRASEERHRELLESLTEGFVALDPEFRHTYVNAAAERLTHPREQLLGRDHWEVYPASVGTALERNLRRAMAERVTEEFENHYAPWDKWYALKAFPTPDGGIGVLYREVTAAKRAEAALRAGEEKYRTLFESIDEGFCVLEVEFDGDRPVDYRIVEQNPAFDRHTGLTGVVGRSIRQAVPGLEEFWFETYGRVAATGEPTRFEHGADALGGRWFDVYAFRVGHPAARRVAVVFNDVTARRRAEAELRASEQAAADRAAELEAVLRAAPAAIWIATDPDCRTITGNPSADALLRVPSGANVSASDPDTRPARPFVEVRDDGTPIPADELPIQRAVAAGAEVRDAEVRLRYADGQERHIYGNAAPLRTADGSVRGAVAAFVDVTALKRLEQELREQDRRKDEFLATLAHELRNPLAPVRNGLQILRLSGDPATVERVREMMARQVAHMVRLIDDLLEVSRISRGKIQLKPERVPLADVVRAAVETSTPLIEAGGHALTVDLPAGPLVLDADPVRLAQVFGNLLNNAAKYSRPNGRIRLSARRDGAEAVVEVADAGIGIPADALPRIFDLFSQVDAGAGHRQGGLGIGLSLVKGLVTLHGGSVAARSDGPGTGSTFTVRLPACDAPPAVPATAPADGGVRARVLVVDDNAEAAESLAELLRLSGHEVRTAFDGAEAVAAADHWRPAAVLLDLGMPNVDGLEACRRIRGQEWGLGMLLVAVTGWGTDDDRRRTAEAGFDHHLTKPVDPDELARLLSAARAG